MPFWRMLKEGNDHFEVTRQEPKVDVCEKRYVFNAEAPQMSTPSSGIKLGTPWAASRQMPQASLKFNPAGKCPVYEVPADVLAAVKAKQRRTTSRSPSLLRARRRSRRSAPAADGGMHPTFLAEAASRRKCASRTARSATWSTRTPRSKLGSYVNPPLETYPASRRAGDRGRRRRPRSRRTTTGGASLRDGVAPSRQPRSRLRPTDRAYAPTPVRRAAASSARSKSFFAGDDEQAGAARAGRQAEAGARSPRRVRRPARQAAGRSRRGRSPRRKPKPHAPPAAQAAPSADARAPVAPRAARAC